MRNRSTKRTLGSMFLAFEAIIIFFGTLVSFGLKFADAGTVWTIGIALALVTIALPGVLGRPGGYVLGWLVQFTVLGLSIWTAFASPIGGFFIFLAVILVSMWSWAMIAGSTIDAARIAYERANGIQQGDNKPEVIRVDPPKEKRARK